MAMTVCWILFAILARRWRHTRFITNMAQERYGEDMRLVPVAACAWAFGFQMSGGSGHGHDLWSASARFGSTSPALALDTSINNALLVILIPASVFMKLS